MGLFNKLINNKKNKTELPEAEKREYKLLVDELPDECFGKSKGFCKDARKEMRDFEIGYLNDSILKPNSSLAILMVKAQKILNEQNRTGITRAGEWCFLLARSHTLYVGKIIQAFGILKLPLPDLSNFKVNKYDVFETGNKIVEAFKPIYEQEKENFKKNLQEQRNVTHVARVIELIYSFRIINLLNKFLSIKCSDFLDTPEHKAELMEHFNKICPTFSYGLSAIQMEQLENDSDRWENLTDLQRLTNIIYGYFVAHNLENGGKIKEINERYDNATIEFF